MDRPGDVLDPLLAEIPARQVELVGDALVHHIGEADAARLGQSLEPSGDVHPVAEDVAIVEDHVAEVDAYSIADAARLRHLGLAVGHRGLDRDGAFDGVDHARELDQQAIAGGLDDMAVVVGDLRVDQLATMRLLAHDRVLFVEFHKPGEADHVGGENCREAPFHGMIPPRRYYDKRERNSKARREPRRCAVALSNGNIRSRNSDRIGNR